MTTPHVLIVDDNREMAEAIGEYLAEHGYRVSLEGGGAAAMVRLKREPVDAVVTDLRMNEVDGLDLVASIRARDPTIPVILMTAFGGIETAVEAIKRGAFHYLTKPLKLEELRVYIDKAIRERQVAVENRSLRQAVSERFGLENLVGKSEPMRNLYSLIERVAPTDSLVLITGESGTGKELVARAIHLGGQRARAPFVAVNCTAIPAGLLESELFGHVKGAFTGATQAREGVFVEAHRGTLFLDEIGDMSLESQSRLLRTLEDGLVRPVGGAQSTEVDVRIIAATNQDLPQLVLDRKFREDLYFRINVIPLHLPPLRERAEDIPMLVDHFLERQRARVPASVVRGFSADALRVLMDHPWPGNVRSLEKTVERLVVLGTRALVEAEDLIFLQAGRRGPLEMAQDQLVSLREVEDRYIEHVLQRVGGNKVRAAQILEVDPSTLYRRGKRRTDGPDGP